VPLPCTSATTPRARVAVIRGGPRRDADAFARDVRRGLSATPKSLPCQYFYDAVGSRLFEAICTLSEYYPTRTEDAILRAHAGAMLDGLARPFRLVELGSGSSTKTRRLISAALAAQETLHYMPIDVSEEALEAAAHDLVREFDGLRVTAHATDYETAWRRIASRHPGPKLVVFLGSSLGNFETDAAVNLLASLARGMSPDDRLLLGTDLDKPASVLEPAYDDADGVTARFNKNLLGRINRELGARFDLDQFEHRACYVASRRRIEMHLISRVAQEVPIPAAGFVARFAEGESIHTENSHKYTLEDLSRIAARSGFAEEASWSDARGWFRLQRWRPSGRFADAPSSRRADPFP
jgi:L-histidine N-alpha-methyltransferase